MDKTFEDLGNRENGENGENGEKEQSETDDETVSSFIPDDKIEFHLHVSPGQRQGDNVDLRGDYSVIPNENNSNIINLVLKMRHVFCMHQIKPNRQLRRRYISQRLIRSSARKPYEKLSNYRQVRELCKKYKQINSNEVTITNRQSLTKKDV